MPNCYAQRTNEAKHQISSIKFQTSTNERSSNDRNIAIHVFDIGILRLGFVWCLELGAWCLVLRYLLLEVAFSHIPVRIDPAVAEEGPVGADDVDEAEIALGHENLLVFVRRFGEQIAVRIADE